MRPLRSYKCLEKVDTGYWKSLGGQSDPDPDFGGGSMRAGGFGLRVEGVCFMPSPTRPCLVDEVGSLGGEEAEG